MTLQKIKNFLCEYMWLIVIILVMVLLIWALAYVISCAVPPSPSPVLVGETPDGVKVYRFSDTYQGNLYFTVDKDGRSTPVNHHKP